MKVLSFGSLNFDHVYQMDHFVMPKETTSSLSYSRGFGGKGLNQSIALAKSGLDVYHAGRVGFDGQPFIDYLQEYGVKVDYLKKDEETATGHAIIQVSHSENCIILYGGANQLIDEAQIDEVLTHFEKGDLLLIQNEISSLTYLITKAHEKDLRIAFNTAPMDEKIFSYPLDLIDIFVVNEVEGKGLANVSSDQVEDVIAGLQKAYPNKEIILTVGSQGSYYISGETVIHQEAYRVEAVDTTAAGDTFTGFYLASILRGEEVNTALRIAAKASSITVTKEGAAKSIPTLEQVLENMKNV
mgnify:FL=1